MKDRKRKRLLPKPSSAFPPRDFIMPSDFQSALTPSGYSIIDSRSIVDPNSGRMFQGYREGQYFFPNDGIEQDRLDMQHHMYLLLLEGKLALAPMSQEPKYVLDVATGTGIWARDFAKRHPTSYVIGTDLSNIQPTKENAPGIEDVQNVEFIVDDSQEEWVFPQVPHGFDYVHLRLVFTCFGDPQRVMRHAFDNLQPGGWIEYQDGSSGFCNSEKYARYLDLMERGLAKAGRNWNIAEEYGNMLRETGFVDIVQKKYLLPMSPWPADPRLKEVGRFNLKALHEGLRGMSWKLLESMGLSPTEIETTVSDAKNAIGNLENRPYYWFWVVYARKPFPGEKIESSEIKTEVVGVPGEEVPLRMEKTATR